MATLRELTTKLSFSSDTKPLVDVGKAIEHIKSRLNLLVGVEAIKGIMALTDRFGNFALDLRNAAAAAGLTTDEFQKLSYAAAQSGLSQETMASTLKSLNKRLQEARLGSESAALAFAYAGIQPEQLGSFRNAEDALYALGKSLNAIQDPVRRAAAAQDTLGEQGPRLLASIAATRGGFRDLAQSADAAASVVSGKNVDALAHAEQAMAGLRAQVTSLAAKLGAALAPAVTSAIKGISKFIAANQAFIRLEFATWARRAAYVLGAVAGVVAGLAHDFVILARQIYAWGNTSGVFARVEQGIRLIGKAVTGAMPIIKALGQALFDTFGSFVSTLLRVGGAINEAVSGIAKALGKPLDIGAWEHAFSALYRMVSELARAPFAVIVSAMENLYGAADKLYQLLFGGGKLEDTYLGKWARAFGFVSDKLGFGTPSTAQGASPSQAEAKPFAMPQQSQAYDMMRGSAQAVSPMMQPANSSQQIINAPISINIKGDANSAPVLQAVKDGVSQHFAGIMAQAQAGTTPGMVY